MATVFLSPGVFTREQDFTIFASRVGITRLGLVGKTLKGPAFEPVKIASTDEYLARFGSTNPKFSLPYVANAFLAQSNELTVTRILGQNGFTNSGAWLIVAGTGSTNAGSVLAVLRSKANQISGEFSFNEESDVTIGGLTTGSTPLSSFVLSATTGPMTGITGSGMTVSLDETRDDYIVRALGESPDVITGEIDLYVESIFPHYVRESFARGELSDLSPTLVYANDASYTDYADSYSDAVTPWVVSRVIGNEVRNLFKVRTISDGDSANQEIKISIQNIDINNYTFDLLVRSFNDTDKTASQTALERFSNLSLDETSNGYIARVIGTTDEDYPRRSSYITVEMAQNIPSNTVPGGFRGYSIRNNGVSGTTAPDLFYKTTYLSGDSIFRSYLGLTELGYTSQTQNEISFQNSIKTLEKDFFSYQGGVSSGMTTVNGFHMESAAPTGFTTGDKISMSAYTNAAGTRIDRNKLKFTLVPAGGFDGWDKLYSYEEQYEEFAASKIDNSNSFKAGIGTFSNPEEVDINLFATPGIDFSNNFELINSALEMVEDRADSLYIMDAPRLTSGEVKGTPEEIVSILDSTGIDSSYAATYWPWIQIIDANNSVYTYQAPTMGAVQAIALTDNVANPWFAPAGINRGLLGDFVNKVDVKMNAGNRDTLYQGRINPIASFVQQGIVIFGQKTLQRQSSSLDRINVRRLLLQVRRLVAAASLTLLFEQNDQTLRDQFLAKVEPILLNIQNQRGLNAFNVVMDDTLNSTDTIDRNTLVGKIQLQPTPSVEFIDLTFQVLPTGASFEDF